MLHRLAEDITFYLITNKIIDIEDKEVYIYGLELLISTLFTSISILAIAAFIEEISSAIIFLLIHFILKSYTGGYHAEYYFICYIYSILTFIVLIFLKNRILLTHKPIVGALLLIVSLIIVFIFAPVTNKNNPKTDGEIAKNKKIARKRVTILSLISILGYLIKPELIDIWFMIAVTISSIAYSILRGKFIERGDQNEEY
jgi:accessory gene regulator B